MQHEEYYWLLNLGGLGWAVGWGGEGLGGQYCGGMGGGGGLFWVFSSSVDNPTDYYNTASR